MKQLIIFIIGILFSLNFISALGVSYMPINQPDTETWQQWAIIKSTDIGFDVDIENPRSQSTEICLLSKTATSPLSLDVIGTKNVYDERGRQITTLVSTSKLISLDTKYGYCYTTNRNQDYIKFGEASTIIQWVNSTGGNAWMGYANYIPFWDYTPVHNNNFMPPFSPYTAGQKSEVSEFNTTYVRSSGNGLGGQNCALKQPSTSACSTHGITDCNNYFTYTNTTMTACFWVPTPGICTAGGQACNRYPLHEYRFNIIRTNVYNITTFTSLRLNGVNPPNTNVAVNTYLYNHTLANWVNVQTTTCLNITACNLTYSTTNIKDFVSSNGFVDVVYEEQGTFNLDAYYTELRADYKDILITYRSQTQEINIFKRAFNEIVEFFRA